MWELNLEVLSALAPSTPILVKEVGWVTRSHDPGHNLGASCKPEATEGSEDRPVLTTAGTEFTMLPQTQWAASVALEPVHASGAVPDPAVVLLVPVVEVGTSSLSKTLAQHGADRPRV